MPKAEYYLYGSEMSLYSGKARSYLRKKGVRFETRSTRHPGYARARDVVGHAYQPILETADGTIVQDTTAIIDFIEAREPGPSVYPEGPCQHLVALLLELYGDEGLLKPAMHYRWDFPEQNDAFLASEFGLGISDSEIPIPDGDDPRAAGEARWKLVSGFMRGQRVPALGVTPASVPSIEEAYGDLLDLLAAHFEVHPYFLGGRPSVGDFGMLAPLYAHLGRDPEPVRLMKSRAPMLYRWVERMNVSDPGLTEFPDVPTEFLARDAVPETVRAILSLAARDYLPELRGIFEAVGAWLDAHPEVASGHPVPGTSAGMGTQGPFGTHEVLLRGTRVDVHVRHYSIWMAQRPIDYYRSLTGADRDAAHRLLAETGLLPLFEQAPTWRIERRNNEEVFVRD